MPGAPGLLDKSLSKIERSGKDVLVMHGLVESLKNKKTKSVGEHELNDSLLKHDFDYIALGHFHGQVAIAGNAWYSGSIEYFNFGEAQDKKGMLHIDLETGQTVPVQVRPKYMIDHPAVDCTGMCSQDIAGCLLDLCSEEEVRDRMVRITLKNVNRAAYRNIDQGRLSRLGASALYFKIKPEFLDEDNRIGRPVDRLKLDEEFTGFMKEESYQELIPKAIKEDVVAYGSEVMRKAVQTGKETLDAS